MRKLILCLGLCLSLCAEPGLARADELVLSAAASLTTVLHTLKEKFEQARPGLKVVENYAAQGTLLSQIESGAPVDVFISADSQTMDKAGQKNLILPQSRKTLAANQMSLYAPAGTRLKLGGLTELADSSLSRVALGNPETTAIGKFVKKSLVEQRLWDKLGPRLILGESVRQVLRYILSGEVEAAFLFASEAALEPGKLTPLFVVGGPADFVYPAAVVAGSKNKILANEFVEFLASPEAREIFLAQGFSLP